MKQKKIWYKNSLIDRTLFSYLRNKGHTEDEIRRLAIVWAVISTGLILVGFIFLFLGGT